MKDLPYSLIFRHWRCTAIAQFLMSIFVYVFHKIQFFCNFIPCISVDVAFLVRHFVFVVKARIKSLFCSINISSTWLERHFLSDIFPKVQLIFKLNPNLNLFHIYKVSFFTCFSITLVLAVLSCYAQYDFAGFFSC